MKPNVPKLLNRWLPLALFTCLTWAHSVTAVNFPLRWRWSNPSPHGNNIADMVSGLGITVQVTERGQLYASSDLLFWEPLISGVTNGLRATAFLGDRLLVTGDNGLILWADSLEFFQPAAISPATTDWFEGIATSDILAVAVGDNSSIYTSSTGTNWTKVNVTFPGTPWLTGITWGPVNGFVAVGEKGFVARSSNGTSWNQRNSGTTNFLNRVRFVNGRYYAFGDNGTMISSLDGSTWSALASGMTNGLYDATGDGTNAVFAGDPEVRVGPGFPPALVDEIAAVANSNRPPRWTYFAANWLTNQFLIAGRTGMTVQGFKTNAADANFTWLTHSDPVRNWLWDVVRLPEFYVAVGDFGTILTSDGGLNWDLEVTPPSATNSVLLGIGGTTNTLVAVGNKGTILYSQRGFTNIVVTNLVGSNSFVLTNTVNTLGSVWQSVQSSPTTNDLHGIAVYGNLFVACGANGTILTSSDSGTNWTLRASGTNAYLSSIASTSNGVVAVGARGTILTSTDGITGWIPIPTGSTNWIYRVRQLEDKLVAVGENGTIFTSPNRTTWAPQASGTTSWLNDVTRITDTNTFFFAIGTQGTALASSNGITWTNIGTITGKALYGAANNGAGQLLAVGVEGAILRAQTTLITNQPRILSYSRGGSNNAFLFVGKPDQKLSLDRSVDLSSPTNWIAGPLIEVLDPSGTSVTVEPAGTNEPPAKFFRVRLVQ